MLIPIDNHELNSIEILISERISEMNTDLSTVDSKWYMELCILKAKIEAAEKLVESEAVQTQQDSVKLNDNQSASQSHRALLDIVTKAHPRKTTEQSIASDVRNILTNEKETSNEY